VLEDDKAEAAFNYFSDILGISHDREDLHIFEVLEILRRDLSELSPFHEGGNLGSH
jgi:hypothetical protein